MVETGQCRLDSHREKTMVARSLVAMAVLALLLGLPAAEAGGEKEQLKELDLLADKREATRDARIAEATGNRDPAGVPYYQLTVWHEAIGRL
jgi:hypothetical protein